MFVMAIQKDKETYQMLRSQCLRFLSSQRHRGVQVEGFYSCRELAVHSAVLGGVVHQQIPK